MEISYFRDKKQKAETIYKAQKTIYNPYLKSEVILNSDGFHHLQFSARRERSKEEQLLKFMFLPIGLKMIREAGTLQEYRKYLCPIGKKSKKDGSRIMKMVEWWGFISLYPEQNIMARTILRRVGGGNIAFWSVMRYKKFGNNNKNQKTFFEGIEDD